MCGVGVLAGGQREVVNTVTSGGAGLGCIRWCYPSDGVNVMQAPMAVEAAQIAASPFPPLILHPQSPLPSIAHPQSFLAAFTSVRELCTSNGYALNDVMREVRHFWDRRPFVSGAFRDCRALVSRGGQKGRPAR